MNRLKDIEGDWHEFESKAHRKENERKDKEARRAEYQREKEKRRACAAAAQGGDRDAKRQRPDSSHSSRDGGTGVREGSTVREGEGGSSRQGS